MYRGVAGEVLAATRAVRATRALAVTFGAEIAQTFFHSTSGGRTAANEEGFGGGLAIPYLRSVDDPYDSLSPFHAWTVRLDDRDAQRKLSSVRAGDLDGLEVSATTPTGRVTTVDVVGADATVPVSGAEIRRLLELRSTWFTIRREDTR
jgi:stage II sporulation protein D